MGDPQGHEELIPYVYGRICGTAPYYRQPCICMVGQTCAGEVQPHHRKSEIIVLCCNAQVWRQYPKVSARGKGV